MKKKSNHQENNELSPDLLINEAIRMTGLGDFGADDFKPGLITLAKSFENEAMLNAQGRLAARNFLLKGLINRLHLTRNALKYRQINEIKIERPVVIVGLLRSGTSFLHNLISQHSKIDGVALWELETPADRNKSRQHQKCLINETQAYVEAYNQSVPELKKIHPIDAHQPDECHLLFRNIFMSMAFETRFHVPSYAHWLRKQDIRIAYRYHRHQLQHILWRKPRERLLLKCPFHYWNPHELMSTYPDCSIILIHRNVAQSLPSTCSLSASLMKGRSNYLNPGQIGQKWFRLFENAAEQMMTFRMNPVYSRQILNIDYEDLVRNRNAVLKSIFRFIDLEYSRQDQTAIEAWVAGNKKNKHGVHRYRASQFGLNDKEISRRFNRIFNQTQEDGDYVPRKQLQFHDPQYRRPTLERRGRKSQ